ncbi:unnamed protein product, partial [Trypanosoma congolense IL3000]
MNMLQPRISRMRFPYSPLAFMPTTAMTMARASCCHLSALAKEERMKDVETLPSPSCSSALKTATAGALMAKTVLPTACGEHGVKSESTRAGADITRRGSAPIFWASKNSTGVKPNTSQSSKSGCSRRVSEELELAKAVERLHNILSGWYPAQTTDGKCNVERHQAKNPVDVKQAMPRNTRDELPAALAFILERDPVFGLQLLGELQGDALRKLLVISTTQEYLGREGVEKQLRQVDADQDNHISPSDYDRWMETVSRERAATRDVGHNGRAEEPQQAGSTSLHQSQSPSDNDISWSLWFRIACSAAVPFMAFGLLDNSIFVTAGDAIDRRCAEAFGLTSMGAAALGGVVS